MQQQKFSYRKLVPAFLKPVLRKLYFKIFKFGYKKENLPGLSPIVIFSATEKKWDYEYKGGFGGWLPIPIN